MYKQLYKRFLDAHPHEFHFACHSHHYWPDVSREAHLQYWDDACRLVDEKWNYIFSQKVPEAQRAIAQILNLSHPSQIVFAPNTHEFVFRLASSLNWQKKVRILTTDSEFYSFDRQINRLAELGHFEVVKVPTAPIENFEERFEKEMSEGTWDLIFLSHVFFNSGWSCDFKRLALSAPPEAMMVVDGYHGFMALPTDLKDVENRIFYLAGSYKYAQGGEGACFLYVPPQTRHRPLNTGWFAELSPLSSVKGEVGYPVDALQYAGSTMDFAGLYRLIAVLEKFAQEGLTVEKIHHYVTDLQEGFLHDLFTQAHPLFNARTLLPRTSPHGHFLTFELPSVERTQQTVEQLRAAGVWVDSRKTRLRFGFGLYQSLDDVREVVARLQRIL